MPVKTISLAIIFVSLSITSSWSFDISKGVIGDDDRVITHDAKIGRLHFKSGQAGCTGTLISKSCGITAGHCKDSMFSIEFNVPSNSSSGPVHSKSRDKYKIDRNSIVLQYNALDDEDWAVFRIIEHKPISKISRWFSKHFEKNSKIENYPKQEGYFPGEIQKYYDFTTTKNFPGDGISITGYGFDKNKYLDRVQRSADGQLIDKHSVFSPFAIFHNVDTTPGQSGAAIIDTTSGKIIGVHNAFVCNSKTKTNC